MWPWQSKAQSDVDMRKYESRIRSDGSNLYDVSSAWRASQIDKTRCNYCNNSEESLAKLQVGWVDKSGTKTYLKKWFDKHDKSIPDDVMSIIQSRCNSLFPEPPVIPFHSISAKSMQKREEKRKKWMDKAMKKALPDAR